MDQKLEDMRRQLDQKTTEIESFVAQEEGLRPIENMDPTEYERLQQRVEELLEEWEETAEEGASSESDTPLNRLIAERFDIERQILAIREQGEGEGEFDHSDDEDQLAGDEIEDE